MSAAESEQIEVDVDPLVIEMGNRAGRIIRELLTQEESEVVE